MERKSRLLVYNLPNGKSRVDVLLQEVNLWMTQQELAELYQTSILNINMHIKNIYEEGELDESSTIKSDLIVQLEGTRKVKRTVLFYNLGVSLLSVVTKEQHTSMGFSI